jgi:spore germination protein YaaH
MRNSRYIGYFVIISALWGILGVQLIAQESSNWCVSLWYPSSDEPSGIDSIRQNTAIVDVIYPFWYTPNADFTLQAYTEAEDEALLAEWREANTIIMPSIFSAIPTMLATPETRTFHVQQIVDLVERMNYDGIDIDYEAFPLETRETFSLFIEELAQTLHANNRLLSMAVHAKTNDKGTWESAEAQDWTRLAPAVDVFNIMTYDYTSRNEPPGAISPLAWMDEVLAYAQSITDLSKVRVGLQFYGYTWLRDKPPATTTTWLSAQRLIESFDLMVERDENQEARIDFKARGLPKQTVIFADSATIAYKLEIIQERYPDLGGVAIWGIGGEDPANWTILREADHTECSLRRR